MSASPTDRFRRVDAVFDAVLDLPANARAAYIERACAGDPDMRAEVIRLLAAYNRSERFLESPAVQFGASLLAGTALLDGTVPDHIGPFRVVRKIGQGGMGEVFLGERADGQFEQRVALKLIQHGTPGLVRRFLEERRILALLEHPRIARLIDGGITPDGLPYFAMELVEGEPIDRYCETQQLTAERRLELFADVCDAVTYAHQHLVIHRDLKPSNILVTADGQIKLLDFGIAKLLSPDQQFADITRTQFHVMTPEFAAPEQVRGESVSTATDVYALGVLLYILLAGERPYDVRGKSPAEVERIVCEQVPAKPSSMAAHHVRRRLRGDLDLIVLTALHKDPARRYRSPAELVGDLRRFRAGRPVRAQPDTMRYRARKYVGRHRAGLGIAAALVLALTGAAGRERVLRNRAETETRKAKEVENFLVSVFEVADPYALQQRDGGSVSARELLDRGASKIDSTLTSQPEIQGPLRSVLGRVYTNLGLFDKAIPLLERSLAQQRSLYGERHASVAAAMDQLGFALTKQDRYDDAEPLLRAALAQRRQLFGDLNPATAESLEHLAIMLEQRNDYERAEPLHREALAIRRSLYGDTALAVAKSLNSLGLLLFRKGKYDDAEPLYRKALPIHIRQLGQHHPETAGVMQNLAQIQQMRGRLDEAEAYYRSALAAKRKSLGNAHPSVTINLNNLGNLLGRELGRLEEAEALTREALALDRQIFGEQHSYVAASLGNLGNILKLKGQLAAAEQHFQQSLAINRSLFGEQHHAIALDLNSIGMIRNVQGDLAAASRYLREATAQYRELLGNDHINTITVSNNLARTLLDAGNVREAEDLLRANMDRLDPQAPRHRMQIVNTQTGLGLAALAQGRVDEALVTLEQAAETARAELGKESSRTADAELALARAYAAAGRYSEAESLLRTAQTTLQKEQKANPRLAAQAQSELSRIRGRAQVSAR